MAFINEGEVGGLRALVPIQANRIEDGESITGAELRELRISRGRSLEDIAERVGMSPALLDEIERCVRLSVDFGKLREILRVADWLRRDPIRVSYGGTSPQAPSHTTAIAGIQQAPPLPSGRVFDFSEESGRNE